MNAPFLVRNRPQKRVDRFQVMSAALDLFRTRQTNLAKRDHWSAAQMRFAGEEARFCIAEVKAQTGFTEQMRELEEQSRRTRVRIVSAMSVEQREVRIAAILRELEAVEMLPFEISASKRRADLTDELRLFQEPGNPWNRDVTDSAALGLIEAVQSALQAA